MGVGVLEREVVGGITIETLRKEYPEPVQVRRGMDWDPKAYCVGGALALELGYEHRIPTVAALSVILMEANRYLDIHRAERWAGAIIFANDLGDMEGAWGKLGRALQDKGDYR